MKQINIDIETYSNTDLTKAGAYKYADDPSFSVLLFGYSVDQGPVRCIQCAKGEEIPEEIIRALQDPNILKFAFNAAFERTCMSAYLGVYLSPVSWRCTMVASLYLGLPGSLAAVGAVLGLEKQKLVEGKELIKYFSVPCKPTKTNGLRTRNLPEHDLEKWDAFVRYNIRDVETEMGIAKKVSRFPVPDYVWKQYILDQRINDNGVAIDMRLAQQAIRCDEEYRARYLARAQELTGLENPNSPIQLKEWLESHGANVESLAKKEVKELLATTDGEVKEVLQLRQLLSKSSVKKYAAMETCCCRDGRAHGLLQFYGANRTGRWAGRLIQVQNLPQNHISDLEVARSLIRSGCFEAAELLYDSVPDLLSQLIRTAFVPNTGCKFIVADFSAVEARALSWMAGEKWRMDVFAENGDIYCASASQMFGVPVVKHGVNGELRQKGKIAELALGYGGSVGAMVAMGALDQGLTEDELKPIVDSWRQTNPKIVQLWWEVDKAVMTAMKEKKPTRVKCFTFHYESGFLIATLPSGRQLFYAKPRIEKNKYDRDSLTYEGVGAGKRWERIETYGPKLVENCLAEGTTVLTDHGLIPIQKVTSDMRIWDGEEWVRHEGLLYKGNKEVINVDGVLMTPEHKIFTTGGWEKGAKANGLNWANVQLPNSFTSCREYKKRESTVDMPVHLWERDSDLSETSTRQKVSPKILRLHEEKTNIIGKQSAQNESSSSIWSLALYETKMYRSKSSCTSQLWWKGNKCVRSVVERIRKLLGGYGTYLGEGTRFGSDRQQQGLFTRKLPVDEQKAELSKQTEQSNDRNTLLETSAFCSSGINRNWRNDPFISFRSRVPDRITVRETGLQKPVYDIKNCGPRHQFVIWNGKQFCIVSNCTQALCRDLLAEAMQRLSDAGYRIVMHVHDEVVIEAPMETDVDTVCKIMSQTPSWARGLILNAAGYECMFYQKD